MSYNKVVLIGRLGKDPEVRHLESGTSVASFTVATNEKYKDRNGERKESTEWHNVEVWRGLANVAEQYLSKGKLVCVEGKLKTENWEDKESGKTMYRTKIVADNFKMLGGRDEEGGSNGNKQFSQESSHEQNTEPEEIADDLPF